MSVETNRIVLRILLTIALGLGTMITTSAQRGADAGEWRHYGGDLGSTKYSPLDQINRDNVADLQVAWRWRTDNFGPRLDLNYQATPLMVGGVLYRRPTSVKRGRLSRVQPTGSVRSCVS